MTPEIKAALITGVCTLLAALVPITYLLIKNRNLSIGFKYISPGMAVAYYHSFIERFFNYLNELDKVYILDNDKHIELNNNNVSLKILMPKVLDNQGFKDSEKLMKERYKTGTLMHGKNILFKDIIYTQRHNNAYIMLDIPNILKSAANYYQGSTRRINFEISEKWEKLNKKELQYFQDTIIRMAKNSRNFSNKIDIEIIE